MKFIFHKQKPSATEAEDSSLMESIYNCGVYNKGNNLENNNTTLQVPIIPNNHSIHSLIPFPSHGSFF